MNTCFRETIAEIDLTALADNFLQVKRYVQKTHIMAVIKSDAYGHGMLAVARCLSEADAFAVACVDEAIVLRKNNINKAIVVLEGFSSKEELYAILKYQLIVVVNNFFQLQILTAEFNSPADKYSDKKATASLLVWLKLNTGMGRLGFQYNQLPQLQQQLAPLISTIKIAGLFSHFCCADDPSLTAFSKQQLVKFEQWIKQLGYNQWQRTFANSAAIINLPTSYYQWVRPGIMLYGVNPILNQSAEDVDLQAVMTLKSKLIAINDLQKGDCIGYAQTWCCPENMPVGIVAIGYGDGYPRHAKSGTPVLINGIKTQLLGRVSMDMISIDLRPLRDNHIAMSIGDSVILWGKELAVEEVAQYSATIAYELLCGISQRVKYVYKK